MNPRAQSAYLFLASCILGIGIQTAGASPRLGIVIVVDQLCEEQMERYAPLFTDGLARLLKEGIVFTEAHHDHAMTLTGPGHATLATGCHPKRHGVVGNHWYDRAAMRRVYCCEDTTVRIFDDQEALGRSPRSLLSTALGDWLKVSVPGAKVFSVSAKDRSAILMGGRNPDGAFWLDDSRGDFTSSTYYRAHLPGWVEYFNSTDDNSKYRSIGWRRGWPEEFYRLAGEDPVAAENDGVHNEFPHGYDSTGMPGVSYYDWFLETSFWDRVLLDFAKTLISEESLGKDSIPDLLWIGFTATDYIGHAYGPHSHEVLDQLLRLDTYVGDLLRHSDSTVGLGNYVVLLSSDHGVMPFPEETKRAGGEARRILRADVRSKVDEAVKRVSDRLRSDEPLIIDRTNGLTLNVEPPANMGMNAHDLRKAVAAELVEIEFVEDVLTFDELFERETDSAATTYSELYRNSFHPDRTPDLVIRYAENTLIHEGPFGTTHGTPYRYDTHVPLIFWGHGVAAPGGPVTWRVRTIDAAPTLAVLLGIEAPRVLDGRVLTQVTRIGAGK